MKGLNINEKHLKWNKHLNILLFKWERGFVCVYGVYVFIKKGRWTLKEWVASHYDLFRRFTWLIYRGSRGPVSCLRQYYLPTHPTPSCPFRSQDTRSHDVGGSSDRASAHLRRREGTQYRTITGSLWTWIFNAEKLIWGEKAWKKEWWTI